MVLQLDRRFAQIFAVVLQESCALKHTIPGDLNLVSLAEVQHLVSGDVTGRVQR